MINSMASKHERKEKTVIAQKKIYVNSSYINELSKITRYITFRSSLKDYQGEVNG